MAGPKILPTVALVLAILVSFAQSIPAMGPSYPMVPQYYVPANVQVQQQNDPGASMQDIFPGSGTLLNSSTACHFLGHVCVHSYFSSHALQHQFATIHYIY